MSADPQPPPEARTFRVRTSLLLCLLPVVLLLQSQFWWLGCSCMTPAPVETDPYFLPPSRTNTTAAIPILAPSPQQTNVLIFLSTECPICNKYAPEIMRIANTYAPRGVQFWLVYPNREDSRQKIEIHQKMYRLTLPALTDPNHVWTGSLGATVTPEVIVRLPQTQTTYRGRINDRYPRLGIERPEPTRHDLIEVLDAIVNGRAVTNRWETAVGCYISEP